MIYEMKERANAASVFGNWKETIIWSCVQGMMGHIYADHMDNSASVMAILGDFCFFAGKPNRELVAYKPEWCKQDFIIGVPQNQQWAEEIEQHFGSKAKKVTRYAMKKEGNIFDKTKLKAIINMLPGKYRPKQIDKQVFEYCKREKWCRDFVSQFDDYDTYQTLGLGVVIMEKGVPVSGASSYSSYPGGIEIEIDTKEGYRRQGLASVCGAWLILKCLERNIYPSWDAQNKWSAALAEKLGYHMDYEYNAYEIWGY